MDILDSGSIFNFKTHNHVPWMYSAFGFLAFLGLAIFVGSGSFLVIIPILLIGVIIFTIYQGVTISTAAKYYQEYNSILGFKTGARTYFKDVEYIFITRRRQGQKMTFVSMEANALYDEYLGWIRFSEKEKIQILIREKKEDIFKELDNLASSLQTRIVDYTEEDN